MSASRSLWPTKTHLKNMVFHLVLLVLLSGVSCKGVESTTEPKVPTAKECRAHVEKALDQYFDSKEPTTPNQGATEVTDAPPQIPSSVTRNRDEDTKEKPSAQTGELTGTSDDESLPECDKDDEDQNEDFENENQSGTSTSLSDENKDDDDDADDDDGEEEEDGYHGRDQMQTEKELSNTINDVNSTDVPNVIVDDKGIEDDKYYPFLYRSTDGVIHELKNLKKGSIESSKGTLKAAKIEAKPNGSTMDESSYQSRMEVSMEVEDHHEVESHDNGEHDESEDHDDDDDDDDKDEGQDETKVETNDISDDDDQDEIDDTGSDDTESSPKPSGKPDTGNDSEVTGTSPGVTSGMVQEFPRPQAVFEQPQAKENTQKIQEVVKEKPKNERPKTKEEPKPIQIQHKKDKDDEDAIENIYEDADDDDQFGTKFRSRDHIDAILALDEIGTDYDSLDDKLAQTIFRDIKRIHATSIKEMEMLYKYKDSTTRLLGDAEIFGKPMILFLGPWGTGKSTIINYLLGTERTPYALKTGTGITDMDFNVITYGDQRQTISGTELAADWRYASLQKFGQGFLDHFKSITMPHTILKKVNLVDTPGILESKKNTERGYAFNDAFQWFIDRADAIYVVLDPTKVDIGAELGSVLDQLKGREVRFILNKSDSIRRSDLMRVVGQLFWNLSPLMSGTEAPVIYATSLSTKPLNPSAPAKFLFDQESNFLYDLKDATGKRVENRILYARRHAVRVRNHAKMVDCYLATFYRHKSIFSSKRNVAKLIIDNPTDYQIYEGLSSMTNVSRYDLPDPTTYKSFFKLYPLYDFKPLASTCSYFRGCPMDKLDNAIANELPELFTKYKKSKNDSPQTSTKNEGR